jgi:hypothetical protein
LPADAKSQAPRIGCLGNAVAQGWQQFGIPISGNLDKN